MQTIKAWKKLFVVLLASLTTIPFSLAARTGFRAMDTAIETISSFFYPSILMKSQRVQIGFYKFMYFLIIFTAINWVLNKFVFNKGGDDANGKRAAGVISFAFSAIASWFMPRPIALASAGLITALFNALLPLAIAFTAIILSFKVWKGENGAWWEHLFGIMVLILAMILINWTWGVIS